MSIDRTEQFGRRPDWLAGALLGAPALLSLFLILHHPTLHGVHGAAEIAQGISGMATLDRIVHGGLMAMYAMQAIGFYLFSSRLGWRRPAVVAAFMAYAGSVIVLIIPTTLDGFVTPDVIATCLAAPGGCEGVEKAAFPTIDAMIQDFTKVALVATSIAIVFWSLTLLSIKSLPSRAAGAAGFLCGGVPIGIIVFSSIRLQPGNLAGTTLPQVIWSLVAAGLLVSGMIGAPIRTLDVPDIER